MGTVPTPTDEHKAAGEAFARLLAIMARLRDPEDGCPWDVEQDFKSIAPYTIEEAYEVADAIGRGSMSDLNAELGDLLFQVAFHSRMAEEQGAFDASDVSRAIAEKMVRRHPHVFDTPDGRSADAQTDAWEDMKAAERAEDSRTSSAIDGVASALPALMRAEKLQKRAARVGFDWTNPEDIFEKLAEETSEVRAALVCSDEDGMEDELGDLLFVVANLARRLNVDPEVALRRANAKFERRFRAMEALCLEDGNSFANLSLVQQEALWQRVKTAEKAA